MASVREFAPAKVNLTLHVTGRRADGLHLLDSLVVFCGIGDVVTASPAPEMTLSLSGPSGGALAAEPDNLCLRAARALDVTAALTLEKHLPVAAGVGGGSADAAATLRALNRLNGLGRSDAALERLGGSLGADVPVCVRAAPRRMTGIGEGLADVPPLPPLWLTLANPGVALPTAEVFRERAPEETSEAPPLPVGWRGMDEFIAWLALGGNDLAPAAIRLRPMIGELLADLGASGGCRIARMSGSGATCFGLFETESAALKAAELMTARGWWSEAGQVLAG